MVIGIRRVVDARYCPYGGTVVVGGRERQTVEALARRGIATYQAEYVLNEKHSYCAYRCFTVRLSLGTY